MEARLVLRSARHLAGLSQRALAARAGVAASVVAEVESGGRPARWDLVVALLAACGLGLSLTELPAAAAGEGAAARDAAARAELAAYLRLSTSARLYWSLGGRLSPLSSQGCPVWWELGLLARQAVVVLAPEAGRGVWLPEHAAPLPLPVLASARGQVQVQEQEHLRVVGPAPALRGTVPVGVLGGREVHVLPPLAPSLSREPELAARMRLAAAVLLAGEAQDEQGRSRAAHRSAQVQHEHAWVMTRRRFAEPRLRPPDVLDRRDWRVDGDASFRSWLRTRGYPIARYGYEDSGP